MNYLNTQILVEFDYYRNGNAGALPLPRRGENRRMEPVDPVMQQQLTPVAVVLEARSDAKRDGAVDRQPAGRGAMSGLAPWQMRKVGQYIDAELSQPIRVACMAAIVRLSSSHFSRAFKISYGAAPASYVTLRRVDSAKRLMLDTDNTLSQISLECGFTDQAHLSRVFRRWTGETPRMWRRVHKQG